MPYFAINATGKFIPYEFTTDVNSGEDIRQFTEFAKEAGEYLVKSSEASVFGLS